MSFPVLPIELLMKIFSFCDDKSKFKLRHVCSLWRNLIKIETIYFFIGLDDFKDYFHHKQPKNLVKMDENKWKSLSMKRSNFDLIQYPNEKFIKIMLLGLEDFIDAIKNFPHLKFCYYFTIERMDKNDLTLMLNTIKIDLPCLEKFIFDIDYSCDLDFKLFVENELTNLKWLIIYGFLKFSLDTESFNRYLLKCENTKILILDKIRNFSFFHLPQSIVTLNHLPKRLTHLNLIGYNLFKINDQLDLKQLKYLGFAFFSNQDLNLVKNKLSSSAITRFGYSSDIYRPVSRCINGTRTYYESLWGGSKNRKNLNF